MGRVWTGWVGSGRDGESLDGICRVRTGWVAFWIGCVGWVGFGRDG